MLSDAVGSFAYICVTLFFCYSAYGMVLNVDKNVEYLKHFWRNRLSSLLIPCLLVNIFGFWVNVLVNKDINVNILYEINPYIIVLLEWCLVFYVVQCFRKCFVWSKAISDTILVIIVLLSSLFYYFFFESKGVEAWWGLWCFERVGLVWGILVYRNKDSLNAWFSKNRVLKIAMLLLLSAIVGICYIRFKSIYFLGGYVLKILLGLSSLVLISELVINMRIKSVISVWLGKISYEVYLCQFSVLMALQAIFPGLVSGLYVFTAVILTIIIAAVINRISSCIVSRIRQ